MAQNYANGEFGVHLRPPSKVCSACLKMFGRPLKLGALQRKDVCKDCRRVLQAGGTIFVTATGQKRVIVQARKDSDCSVNPKYKGKIVQVPEAWLEELIRCGQIRTNRDDAG